MLESHSNTPNSSRTVSRRDFLKSTTAACGAISLLSATTLKGASLVNKNIPVIDTHQHLWDLNTFTLPWMQGDTKDAIGKNFLLPEYRQATAEVPIAQTVYMEVDVTPKQQTQEAEYVLDLCQRKDNTMTGAVIGGSPESAEFKSYVEQFTNNSFFKGVRTVLHGTHKPGTCLKPQFIENMKLLGKFDKSFDLCMRPAEVQDAATVAEQCPETRFILDHCGNMPVTQLNTKLHDQWRAGLKAMAAQPNTICKISGIVVTAADKNWKAADLAPVVNECLDTFGEDRVIFGGDWPVCTLKASYQQWYTALLEITANRSESFKQKLFHANAQQFYKLPSV